MKLKKLSKKIQGVNIFAHLANVLMAPTEVGEKRYSEKTSEFRARYLALR